MRQPADQLAAFADALEANDRERAAELAEEIADGFEELTAEESVTVRRSLLGRRETAPDEFGPLNDHALSAIEVALLRSSFLLSAVASLEAPEGVDDSEIAEIRSLAADLRASRDDLESDRGAAEAVLTDTSMPATLVIAGFAGGSTTVPLGDTTTLDVELRNPGDEAADDVEVSATADDGIGVRPSTQTIARVAGGDGTSVPFTIEAQTPGEYGVVFDVSFEETSTDASEASITVVEPAEDDSRGGDPTPTEDTGGWPGIVGTLAGFGSAGYLLKRRFGGGADESGDQATDTTGRTDTGEQATGEKE